MSRYCHQHMKLWRLHRCLRRNVLVTTLRCLWRLKPFSSSILIKFIGQHSQIVTNITMPSTSLSPFWKVDPIWDDLLFTPYFGLKINWWSNSFYKMQVEHFVIRKYSKMILKWSVEFFKCSRILPWPDMNLLMSLSPAEHYSKSITLQFVTA